MAKRDFYIKDSELDDYQVKVINKRIDVPYIVKGCAGSGKTILALWKAKQIQELNKGTVLYVVFTKALRKYMEEGIRQMNLNSECVIHYDDCFKTEAGKRGRNWTKGEFDYIIVDEAQDFSMKVIELLKSKARKAVFFYGDTAQQLYGEWRKSEQGVSIEDIQRYTNYPMEILVFNHRLPKTIARFAQYLNSQNDELEERCKEEGTEKPKILEYVNKKAQFEEIASLIKNKNLEDVGILFRKNDEVKEAYTYLTALGLNVEAKYTIGKGAGRDEKEELDFSTDHPKLMTYHSSKGLQFENVFLPECTADDVNPLYVAITRTYKSLYIMHSGNLSNLFDNIPVDLYDKSLSTGSTITI